MAVADVGNFRDPWFLALAAFILLVALTGGGSRHDILSLAPLRATSAILLGFALWHIECARLRLYRIPLLLLGAIALTMALQLVPLPPAVWSTLPHRAPFYELGTLFGLDELWRPVTFSPAKTLNSMASLVVPVTVLVLLARIDQRSLHRVAWVFVAVGSLSAALGIAQAALPASSNLYFYAITNNQDAVGLFANRNHNAIFLVCCLLICLLRTRWQPKKPVPREFVAIAAIMLLLLCGILVNASRAGLLGLALALGMFGLARLTGRGAAPADANPQESSTTRMAAYPVGVMLIVAMLLAGFFAFERSPAISRITGQDPFSDLRIRSFPNILSMAGEFQPWGVGFGAFDKAYRTVEPDALLGPRYLNNAHNDWLQFVIEGGIAGALVVAIMTALVIRRALLLVRSGPALAARTGEAGSALSLLLILAVASAVDYPLRTPMMMVFGIWCLAVFFRRS